MQMYQFYLFIFAKQFNNPNSIQNEETACDSSVKQPEVLTYASNTHDYQRIVQVTDVEHTDTATILTFFFNNRMMPGSICILPQTYLSDEQDRHYKALFGVEHPLGEYFFPDKDGTYFHVAFEPMPADVQVFDMIEGEGEGQFKIMGIHAPSYKPAKPEFSKAEIEEAQKIKRALFNKGAVCLRGTIRGYDRSQNWVPSACVAPSGAMTAVRIIRPSK